MNRQSAVAEARASLGLAPAKSRFTYHCAHCDARCTSYHADLQTERYIGEAEKPKKIEGPGLGTWRCPVHGVTKVVRRKT